MAGYQGWFNAPEDGAARRWNYYLPINRLFADKKTVSPLLLMLY